MFKNILIAGLVSLAAACSSDADVVSHNLSKDSDNFKVDRRIVFYNGITNDYMLTIEGKCSRDNTSTEHVLGVVCKVGEGQYKKHLLGLSDNVTFFIEQVEGHSASPYFYKVIFKPTTILREAEVR
ncbi:MAG: hypothetical protein KBC57_03270 [Neisseriaceae bacterium]|nr:hypothetical protein [Neisseriaceae bacterium]